VIKLEECADEARNRDKLYEDRKAAYEKTISSMELQIHRLHEQVDRKDIMLDKLINNMLLYEKE
jgi:hypothetical protein